MRGQLSDLNNYMHDPIFLFLCMVCASSDMRQMRQMMSALRLASARFSKLWILCLNDFRGRCI